MTTQDDILLTTERVAEIFAVSPRTVERWVDLDKFDAHGVHVERTTGGHVRFHRDEVYDLYWRMVEQGYVEKDPSDH